MDQRITRSHLSGGERETEYHWLPFDSTESCQPSSYASVRHTYRSVCWYLASWMMCTSAFSSLHSPSILLLSTIVPFLDCRSVMVISDRARGDIYLPSATESRVSS